MNNFNLHTPTRILFGKGAIAGLREQIPHDARVLITYGGGSVKKTGVLDQVLDALKGMDVLEFGGIEPNPAYETLMNAVKLVREQKVTFLLAVGGGHLHRLRRRAETPVSAGDGRVAGIGVIARQASNTVTNLL